MSTETSIVAAATTSRRLSYRCYNCTNSFQIFAMPSTTATSSFFRCPHCHQRHLLPHDSVTIATSNPNPSPNHNLNSSSSSTTSDSSLMNPNTSEIVPTTEGPDHIDSRNRDSFDSLLERSEPSQSSHRSSTSKSLIDSLPTVNVTESCSSRTCSICMDDFAVREIVNQLPCKHLFHRNCIVPWLTRSNTCPMCRYKFPSEPRGRPRQRMPPSVLRLLSSFAGQLADEIENYQDALLRRGWRSIQLPDLSTSSASTLPSRQTGPSGLGTTPIIHNPVRPSSIPTGHTTPAMNGPTISQSTGLSPEVVHVDRAAMVGTISSQQTVSTLGQVQGEGAASELADGVLSIILDESGDTVMIDAC